MKKSEFISLLLSVFFLFISYTGSSQYIELSFRMTKSFPDKTMQNNFTNFNGYGLQAYFYPYIGIPIGVGIDFQKNNILNHYRKIDANDKKQTVDYLKLHTSLQSGLIGFKISNQHSKSIFNLFFSPKIGLSKSSNNLYITRESTDTYYEPDNTYIFRENIREFLLQSHTGSVYSFEAGLEIAPFFRKANKNKLPNEKRFNLLFVPSIKYNGSFNLFQYYNPNQVLDNMLQSDNPDDFETVKENVLKNSKHHYTNLSYWTFSLGLRLQL